MIDDAIAASAALAAELAKPIDPRTLPVRFSRLKQMARSPLHYWHACQTGDVDGGESLALRLGSGTHALLFGQESRVVVYPGQRRGKAWDAFEEEHAGKIILTATEAKTAHGIVDAVRGHDLARALLWPEPADTDGVWYEHRIDWQRDGRMCRSTPDVYYADVIDRTVTIVDLKTTRDASPDWFCREAIRRAYHAQLVFYAEALGEDPHHCDLRIVAVESKPPHAVVVWQLTPGAIEHGQMLIGQWWEQLRQCEDAGTWPGYTQAMQRLDVDGDMPALIFGDDDSDGTG
jgi:hypothetical protein